MFASGGGGGTEARAEIVNWKVEISDDGEEQCGSAPSKIQANACR
jgi:hypothetical protein